MNQLNPINFLFNLRRPWKKKSKMISRISRSTTTLEETSSSPGST